MQPMRERAMPISRTAPIDIGLTSSVIKWATARHVIGLMSVVWQHQECLAVVVTRQDMYSHTMPVVLTCNHMLLQGS